MRKFLIVFHAILIFLVAACLRAWSMRSEAPTFGEMAATLIALRKPGDYLAASYLDFCPPLYYLILNPLTAISKSLGWLRLPSVMGGSLACLAIYFTGRWLYGAVAGLIAGYLLALHPLHIYYSQQVQPNALFSIIAVAALLMMIRSAETNRVRDWVLYDLCLVVMLYLQREAVFLLAAFPLLQLARAAFYPPVDEQRRIRRPMLLQAILLNHLLIGAVALPWLTIMPQRLPWALPAPTANDLLRVFTLYNLRGMSGFYVPYATGIAVVLYLLFLPPLLRVFRRRDFRAMAVVGSLLLPLLLVFAYSIFKTPRFSAADQAMITLPFFVIFLGLLLARCNPMVRTVLTALLAGLFLTATVRQTITLQNTSWTAMRNRIVEAEPSKQDLAVFWPDFTAEVGKYWNLMYGKEFESLSATELLDQYATLPQESRAFFVVSQFPSRQPHLYTFRGALSQYARSKVLYKERLNMILEATDLDQKNLNLWYKDPESLKVVDQPSSQTQFIFTAADPIFRSNQFEWQRPDLTYDTKGRRCVWTKTRHVDLNLTVTLAPGDYVIRVHCASNFEQPEYDRDIQRVVNVELLSGTDRRKSVVQQETTLNLSTSTDTELKRLHLSIDTEPMVTVPQPAAGTYGLKIYSISIDQAAPGQSG